MNDGIDSNGFETFDAPKPTSGSATTSSVIGLYGKPHVPDQTPGRRPKSFVINRRTFIKGGINTGMPPYLLKEDQWSDCRNFVFDFEKAKALPGRHTVDQLVADSGFNPPEVVNQPTIPGVPPTPPVDPWIPTVPIFDACGLQNWVQPPFGLPYINTGDNITDWELFAGTVDYEASQINPPSGFVPFDAFYTDGVKISTGPHADTFGNGIAIIALPAVIPAVNFTFAATIRCSLRYSLAVGFILIDADRNRGVWFVIGDRNPDPPSDGPLRNLSITRFCNMHSVAPDNGDSVEVFSADTGSDLWAVEEGATDLPPHDFKLVRTGSVVKMYVDDILYMSYDFGVSFAVGTGFVYAGDSLYEFTNIRISSP